MHGYPAAVGDWDELDLGERIRRHFGHHDHLYGVLFDAMGRDWAEGGITRTILADWQDAPAHQMVQLRLAAGLFRIVLRGDEPELAAFCPCLGGDRDRHEVWPVAREAMRRHVGELRGALELHPQTNEPARALALLVGLSEAVRRTGLTRVRLLEPGASAGLGLLVDRYRFEGDGWTAGPADADMVVSGCGGAGFEPAAFTVVERRGCDLAPVDAASAEGGRHLKSFVWPFHVERHARLDGALATLAAHPVRVDRAGAGAWVGEQLVAAPADPEVLTVVWHSVTRMYWPPAEAAAVTEAVRQARSRMPLAYVTMEDPGAASGSEPGLPVVELDGEPLAGCGHHGPPLTMRGPVSAGTRSGRTRPPGSPGPAATRC